MGAILGAVWTFVNSPVGMMVATTALAWIVKSTAKSGYASTIYQYAYLACEAVESMHIGGPGKYEKALGMFKESLRKAGIKADPKALSLFEELARQYALSKKPAPPKVIGRK